MRVLLPAITVYYFNHLVLVRDGGKGYKMGSDFGHFTHFSLNDQYLPTKMNSIVFLLSELTIQIILVCVCSKIQTDVILGKFYFRIMGG